MRLGIVLCGLNGILHIHTVEETAVAHLALLGIEGRLRNVASLDNRHYREIEFLCESVVAAVVGRYCHNGSCPVACEDIFAYPNRHLLSCKRIDAVRA